DNTLTADEDVPLVIATGDLGYSDVDGDVLSKITIDAIPASGTLFVDADGDGEVDGGEALSATDEVSKADLDANRLKFVGATDENGAGYADFDFTVNDGTVDAVAGNTITFDVDAVNDAPVVNAPSTETGEEDTDLVFSIANGNALSITDVDGDAQTVTITATNGTFTLSQTTGLAFTVGDGDDDATMTFSGSVADINAGLAGALFTPDTDYTGAAELTLASADGNGGTDDASIDITVNPFNDPPTADNESITTNEDADYVFSDTDFSANYADVEGDNFDGIKITGLETAGSLLLNGVDVEANDVISLADLSAGNLVFRPDADENGTPYATFTFQVADAAGKFSSDYTLTANVDAIADAPVSADRTITTDEDTDYVFNDVDFAFTENADGDNFAAVIITSLPSEGTLLYNGVAVNSGDVTGETAFADRSLFTYSPAEDGNGVAYTSFGFKVTDDAGDESAEHTITVDATAVNDAPTLTDVAKPAAQDKITDFSATDFTDQFSDVDGDALSKIQITSLPANGTLRLNGVDVVLSDEIAAADLANLSFEPGVGFTGLTSFGWNGHDGTEYAAVGAQVDINVVPQQAPVLTNVPKTSDEDETMAFTAADFTNQFSDADSDPLTKIQITSLPANGTLFLDGVAVAENDEIDAADLSQLTFVPNPDFNGTTAFTWNGHDGFQYSDSEATVELTIDAVQDTPVLSEVSKEGEEDLPVAFAATDFTDQFSDADGEVLTKIQIVSLPENGVLYLNGVAVAVNDEIPVAQLEQLTFEPNANFNGTDAFSWNGFDGTAYATDPAAVTLTVGAVADGSPVAAPATFTVSTDGAINDGTLADFVTDPEGSGLDFNPELITAPANGTLTLNSDGTFTYVPDAGYIGEDSFTYQVCDRSTPEQCVSGTATVNVGDSGAADSDNDGVPDSVEIGDDPDNPVDSDGDGTPDFQDTDSDNDGVPDAVEAGDNPESPDDTDGDGTPDFLDTDSDGDGLSDTAEAGDDPTQPTDSDGDGIADAKETDSDGDGIADSIEAGADAANPVDSDGDGTPDFQDTDSDNDGISDATEVGADPANPADSDGDGTPDFQDTDSDNDGVSDSLEAGDDPNAPVDTDGDGIADFQDTDSDGDGLSDTIEAGSDPSQLTDTDGDGIPDLRETDSDGDGVADATEAGSDPENPRDSDNDGIPDFQETDSDNDGVPDGEEETIVIYKGFSPNQDGTNEIWQIDGIDEYPNNSVQIFNRWGNKIFEVQGYNNADRAWSSESSIGLVLGASEVPDGTYFYIIDLGNGEKPLKGFITVHR
ncbi:MAG: tandem-95 repeat protein, partial [Cyclobacteriaceae bacterium]